MRICWSCLHHNPLSTATDFSDAVPDDGDVAICITCGEWNIFDGEALRKPTNDEYREIDNDPECDHARMAWAAMDAGRRRQAH